MGPPPSDGHKEAATLPQRPRFRLALPKRAARRVGAFLLALLVAGCGSSPASAPSGAASPTPTAGASTAGINVPADGFQGVVVAPEPQAALIGQQVLAAGGDAADAAVAIGLALSVTLPSRAGLGGAGACLAFTPGARAVNGGVPEAVLFTPHAPRSAAAAAAADRPGGGAAAAARALSAARTLRAPAVRGADRARPSNWRASARRSRRRWCGILMWSAGRCLPIPRPRPCSAQADGVRGRSHRCASRNSPRRSGADPRHRRGRFLPGCAGRASSCPASAAAGGPMRPTRCAGRCRSLGAPPVVPFGNDRVAFLPPPADGGLAAAAAFQTLAHDPRPLARRRPGAGRAVVAPGRRAAATRRRCSAANLPAADCRRCRLRQLVHRGRPRRQRGRLRD